MGECAIGVFVGNIPPKTHFFKIRLLFWLFFGGTSEDFKNNINVHFALVFILFLCFFLCAGGWLLFFLCL